MEKLIDWEQNTQLTWAVVLLTATLGLAGILVIDSLSTSIRVFVIILSLTLMAVIDMSFYRLATSLVNLRRYIELIGEISKLYKEELEEKALFEWLYLWFVDTTIRYKPRLRTLRVSLIIGLADLFILSYVFVMIIPIALAEFFIFLCACVLILKV